MSLTVIFWNISKNNVNYPAIREAVRDLIAAHQVDLFFIADFHVNKLLGESRNSFGLPEGYEFFKIDEANRHQRIITIYNKTTISEPKRLNLSLNEFHDVLLIKEKKICLIPVHLKSLASINEQTRAEKNAATILDIKKIIKNNPDGSQYMSAIFGDFNFQPWDERHMLQAKNLNATPDRKQAEKESVVYGKESYPFLYNPSWSLLGDFSGSNPAKHYRPAASYYYERNHGNIDHSYWHMLDQLIIVPKLIPYLEELTLIDCCNNHIFWNSQTGKINSDEYSDHLPLKFKFSL